MEPPAEIENANKTATVQCVQYLVSNHLNSKRPIRKEDLMKTVFKNHHIGKNYERIMNDVANTLLNVFGFSISSIKENYKQFLIINTIEDINIPEIKYTSRNSNLSDYLKLLKPVLSILVMNSSPISEGQMWSIMSKLADKFKLDLEIIKTVFRENFIKDQYLTFQGTDESTIKLDPDKTTNWFSLGPRALIECNQALVLEKVSKLYNVPTRSFKRVYNAVHE